MSITNTSKNFGFVVHDGEAVLKSCSVTSCFGKGMQFGSQDGAESFVEHYTLAQNRSGGIVATGSASVAVTGSNSSNGGAGYVV